MSQPINQQQHKPSAQPSSSSGLKRPIARDKFKLALNTLIRYEPSPHHDALINGVYWKMLEEDVLFDVIPYGSLSALFIAIHPPSTAFFKVDEAGLIWFLTWFEPNHILGPLMAVWISRERRNTKAAIASGLEVMDNVLESQGEVTAITAQPKIVEEAQRFGYDVIGKIEASDKHGERWILHADKRTQALS